MLSALGRPIRLYMSGGQICTRFVHVRARRKKDEPHLALQKEADGGIRTLDPRFTRAVLWPTELRRRCGDECSPLFARLFCDRPRRGGRHFLVVE